MATYKFHLHKPQTPPLLMMLIISCGVIGLVVVMLMGSFNNAIKERDNLTQLQIRMVEGALTRTLESLENSLSPLLLGLSERSGEVGLKERIKKRVRNITLFSPHIRQIVILKGDKTYLNNNPRSRNEIDLNKLAFSEYDTPHLSLNVKIGSPVQGRFLPELNQPDRPSPRSLLPVLLELHDKGQGPRFSIVVGINSQYVSEVLMGLDVRDGDQLNLLRQHGELLFGDDTRAIHAHLMDLQNQTVAGNQTQKLFQVNDNRYLQDKIFIQLSSKYPFAIAFYQDASATLNNWRDDNGLLILGLMGATVCLLLAILLLYNDFERSRILQKENKVLSTAVHQTPVSVLITDYNGVIKYANPAFEKLFGYSLSDTRNNTPSILKSGQTPDEVYRELWKTLRQGKPWQGEFVNKTKENKYIPVSSAISPVIDDNGEYNHIIGVISDISTQKALQEKALEASRQAKLASEAKSNFLATMSHELRTPMTGIKGVIDLLRTGKTDAKETMDLLKDLDTSANSLMLLLNDILDLSKIEAGKLHLEQVPINPAEILRGVAKIFSETAMCKQLDFNVHLPAHGPEWILGDSLRLRQIISNLVSNALKFTHEGAVSLHLDYIPIDQGRYQLTFTVTDTGIGMSKEDTVKVLEPFTQADSSTTRQYGGTGLGLTITKQLCDLLNGSLHVVSEKGKGSTFSVTLPVIEAVAPIEETDDEVGSASLSILLAEDNPINQKIVTTMLRKKGHQVDLAGNGLQAVELAKTKVFDLILMDMQMPELDGIGATRQIRNGDSPNRETTIFAFTADAIPEHHKEFHKLGISDVVTKPVSWKMLEEKLAKLTSDRSTTS